MKNILSAFAIALLLAGALSSCSDYDERLNKLDERIGAIESGKLTSLESQIASINASIAELSAIREGVRKLTEASAAQGKVLEDLEAADAALSERIRTLQAYLDDKMTHFTDKDLVAATYATLAQYDAANVTIREVDAKISPLDQSLSKEISDASDSFSEVTAGLEEAIKELTGRVDALELRIQSIRIIPASSDGSVNARYGLLTLDCIIEPAVAVRELTKDNFAILIDKAQTKAGADVVRLTEDNCFTKDLATGIVSIRVDISDFAPEPGKSVIVAVSVNTDESDCVTEFARAEFTASPNKELKTAVASFNGTYWQFNLSPEDGVSYPQMTVRTKTVRDREHISGNYEIESAVMYTGEATSVQYAGGFVNIECISLEGFYNFKGTTADAEGFEMDFSGNGLSVSAYDATDGDALINLRDNVADWAKVPVTGISLDKEAVELLDGDSGNLTATVTPSNATDNGVVWISSNPEVATVDAGGKICSVAPGISIITATSSDGGFTANCTVTVKPIMATSISLDKAAMEIAIGSGSKLLTATILPENASDKTVIWSSSNAAVATVVEGSVSGVSAGVATITAATGNGHTTTCTVTVVNGKEFDFSVEPYLPGESY